MSQAKEFNETFEQLNDPLVRKTLGTRDQDYPFANDERFAASPTGTFVPRIQTDRTGEFDVAEINQGANRRMYIVRYIPRGSS